MSAARRKAYPWRVRIAGVAVALVLAAIAATAWRAARPEPAIPGDNGRLEIIVSGDTAGWIVPCGCASNQSGGLPRRGAYVTRARKKAEVIVADAGGSAAGSSEYDRLKLAAILKGERALGVVAHNIGAAEAAMGIAPLRRAAAEAGIVLVSANVRGADGKLAARPLRIVSAAGRRVAIIGVLSPGYAANGLRCDPPRQAILDTLAASRGQYDHILVLAYLPDDELTDLAAQLPEADAVVGGPTGQSIAPHRVGAVLLASATNKGKFLVHLSVRGAGEPWTGKIVEMNGKLSDDRRQLANLKEFYRELARRDLAAHQTGFVQPLPEGLPDDYRAAGSAACRKCHAKDCQSWDASRHASAWRTLSDKGAEVDSYCQQCHTTLYGLPGGFVSARRSPAHAAVGCESCHGPSQGHASDPEIATAYAGSAESQCVRCHDRENSPLFAYEPYWQRIAHGIPGAEAGHDRQAAVDVDVGLQNVSLWPPRSVGDFAKRPNKLPRTFDFWPLEDSP